MSGEPEISEGISSEWVQYLQRLMASQGLWQGGDDGAFTPELTAAVIQLQQAQGISPADGTVRQDTWDALHTMAGQPQQPAGGGQPTEPASAEGSGVPGPSAGVPTFQYTLPAIPIAEAAVAVPEGMITASLTIRGTVTVTFQESVRDFTLNVNDGAWRIAASQSLDGLNTGLQIGGLGTDSPYVQSTWQSSFVKTGSRFTPPNTISYTGSVQIGYNADTSMGPVQVTGSPGFQLDVTVTPNVPPAEEPVDEPSFETNYGWLAVAAFALVAAVAIAAAPETGGGSLLLLTAG